MLKKHTQGKTSAPVRSWYGVHTTQPQSISSLTQLLHWKVLGEWMNISITQSVSTPMRMPLATNIRCYKKSHQHTVTIASSASLQAPRCMQANVSQSPCPCSFWQSHSLLHQVCGLRQQSGPRLSHHSQFLMRSIHTTFNLRAQKGKMEFSSMH